MSEEDIYTLNFTLTFQRSELIPGGNGALIAFSDDFPDKQFLIIPQHNQKTSDDRHH